MVNRKLHPNNFQSHANLGIEIELALKMYVRNN